MLLALALAAAPVPVWSQYVLNLRDADVRAFIQDAARVTGRTFIIDRRGPGQGLGGHPAAAVALANISNCSCRPCAPTAWSRCRSRAAPSASSRSSGAAATGRVGIRNSPNGFVTEIFRLRHIDAASAAESAAAAGQPAKARSPPTATRSIVADFADNIVRIRSILASIDRDTAATRVLALDNAGAREIADALGALGGADGKGAGVSVVPIDSSNSVALRGDAAVGRAADGDRARSRPARRERQRDPRHLPRTCRCRAVAAGAAAIARPAPPPAAPSTTGIGDRSVRAAVRAERSRRRRSPGRGLGRQRVRQAQRDRHPLRRRQRDRHRRADRRPAHARRGRSASSTCAASRCWSRRSSSRFRTMPPSSSASSSCSPGLKGSNIPFAVTNYSNVAPNILTIAGAVAARGPAHAPPPRSTARSSPPPRIRRSPTRCRKRRSIRCWARPAAWAASRFRTGNAIFGAIINAVQSDNQSNILSTPSIMTLDNQEARILVGQEIPITTGEALSNNFDNTFRTVQRQNVGITLEVKPQINAGGAIKLDLRQEVSSIAGPVSRNFSRSDPQQARDRDHDHRRRRRDRRHRRPARRQ